MDVGLTFDLREEHLPHEGAPPDYHAEFDSEENIRHLQTAIEGLGHGVHLIGSIGKLVRFLAEGRRVDIVFNMAEGLGSRSREAQVPAVLEAFGIPYTGSDPLTMAVCLDKAMTKRLWQQEGLPTPDFRVVSNMAAFDAACKDLPALPLFVKPLHEGSSKGIGAGSVVESVQDLRDRVEWTLSWYQQPALVERFLPGREFTVGILGNGHGARVLGVGEIVLTRLDQVYGYTQKEEWETRVPQKLIPLDSTALLDMLSSLALRAYHAVECRDLARLEIRLDDEGNPHLLEINPIVGLHPTHSSLPILATQAGLSYEQLIAEILHHAIARRSHRRP
jgi:D-alanine-D-alanine ligase